MNETLDGDLRTMMRTAVANAPEAPTVAELIDPSITANHEQSRAHVRLVGLAAAVLVVAMVAALALRTTARDAELADAPSAAYLDAFYLPTPLPEGWTVIRMDRAPAGGDLQLSDAARFTTSDGSDVGIVNRSPSAGYEDSVGTEPPSSTTAMTAPTLLPEATWDESSRWLTWSSGGDDYTVQVRSGQEAVARSLGAAIQTAADAGRSFDVDLASGWIKTDEQFAGSTPATGTNGVQIADERGRIVWLTVQRTDGLFDIGMWTLVDEASQLYREPTYDGRPAGLGRLIDGYLVTATPNVADAAGAAEAALRAMAAVSAADWEAAAPDQEQSIRQAATLARFALLDHTVTLHSEGPWRGVCVDRSDEAGGCILAAIGDDGTLAQVVPITGIRLSDGSWVAVGSIPADDEMCAGDDLAGARAAAAPYGSQQIVLLVPGDQTQSFACAPGDGQQPFIAMPPSP